MARLLIYLSARPITGSLFRFRALYEAIQRWAGDWEVVVRTPLKCPWESCPGLFWEKTPLLEPSPLLDEERLGEWIREWVRGWSLWVEGEKEIVEEYRPRVILSDMAPQPLLLARETGVPGWFLGHFNWFSYLSQFMEVSGLLDEVASAYEAAQVAFVPPLSWGQGIFPLVQEVPLVGGGVQEGRVREVRRKILPKGVPVFVDQGVDEGRVRKVVREMWGNVVQLGALEDLPAVQVAYVEANYTPLVTAFRGEVPCVIFHRGLEPGVSMALEMEGLGVALAREEPGETPSAREMALLINGAFEAYKALPSLYRLEGSQFLVETLTQV